MYYENNFRQKPSRERWNFLRKSCVIPDKKSQIPTNHSPDDINEYSIDSAVQLIVNNIPRNTWSPPSQYVQNEIQEFQPITFHNILHIFKKIKLTTEGSDGISGRWF